MNYTDYFCSLTDRQLDQMITNLQDNINKVLDSEQHILENLVKKAKKEWSSRYPGTISPSLYKKILSTGGFDFCYTGPRETIELKDNKGK